MTGAGVLVLGRGPSIKKAFQMGEEVEDIPEAVKTEHYRDLEREFTFHGHVLRQIFREKDVAVYSRSFPGRAPHELELVIVRKKKQSTLPDGSIVAASEPYPSSSEWGKYGWSFPVRKEVFVFILAKALVSIEEHRPDFVRKKACYPKGFKAEN